MDEYMKNIRVVVAVLLSAMIAGMTSCASEGNRPAPTLTEAGESEYHGIYDTAVRLVDGRYEGEPFVAGGELRPTVQLLGELFRTGDIDGDGSKEAVVILVENSGGTGSFLYIAVLERGKAVVENTVTSQVGDRVQVRAFKIEAGKMIMDVVQHGPADAMCCPTQKARRSWMLDGSSLVEEEPVASGTISTADLRGIRWVLKQIDRDEQYPGDSQVTLFFENSRISGRSGCNRYFAEITESSPGEIEIGVVGSTRMACPDEVMTVEIRYLAALQGMVNYSYLSGRLVLTCRTGDGSTTMIFGE